MKDTLREQITPLSLTVITFFGLCALLFFSIHILNLLPSKEKIQIRIHPQDVIIGFTIYIKTAIDFAIFIGNVMRSNPGWKKRISIELGSAVGNAGGTLMILIVWNFFREVPLLMAVMIIIASLVLLRMAEESFEEFLYKNTLTHRFIQKPVLLLESQLDTINKLFKPVLGRFIPESSSSNTKVFSFWSLAAFSFSIPFILGLDDFAGYIPLFSIINVFGFAIGVFLGHMILNLGLFLSPKRTTALVQHPTVLIIGGVAFVIIAAWGFWEVAKIVQFVLTGISAH